MLTEQEKKSMVSHRKNNTTGFRGVKFECNKFRAFIIKDGKNFHLGNFESLTEAVEKRGEAEKEIYGYVIGDAPRRKKSKVRKYIDGTKTVDRTGMRYGSCVVTSYLNKSSNRKHYWNCLCDCGEVFLATSDDLETKKVRNCGCGIISKKKKHVHHIDPSYRSYLKEGTNLHRIKQSELNINNKSGVKGVFFEPRGSRWIAKLVFKGESHVIRCETKEKAIKTRKKMEKEYYGPILKKYHFKKRSKKKLH